MSLEDVLFELLDRLEGDEDATVVTSIRQPVALREAVRVAVEAGMDASVNEATVRSLRDRLETFAQRLALESHYEHHNTPRSVPRSPIARSPRLSWTVIPWPRSRTCSAGPRTRSCRSSPTTDPEHVLGYAAARNGRGAFA